MFRQFNILQFDITILENNLEGMYEFLIHSKFVVLNLYMIRFEIDD